MIIGLMFSIASALITRLAFPNYNYFFLAWISLAPFIYFYIKEKELKISMLYSLAFGFFYFGASVDWLPVFYHWAPKPLINFGWFGFALYNGCLFTVFLLPAKLLLKRTTTTSPLTLQIFIIPSLWIIFDWIKSLGCFGNTLGSLAVSQYLFINFIQLARFIGANGLSFIIVFINSALAYFIYDQITLKNKTNKKYWLLFWTTILIAIAILGTSNHLYMQEKIKQSDTKKISIYQPNIPQETKKDRSKYPWLKRHYLDNIEEFCNKNTTDLIVMPETIVPEFLLNNRNFIFALQDRLNTDIIFGTPRMNHQYDYFNSAIYLDQYGRIKGKHDKKYLVPFGEYVPFRKYFYWILRPIGFLQTEYTKGIYDRPVLDKYAIAVCFESTFPYQARATINNGGQALFVVTNDGWFKTSSMLEQHLAYGVLRAVENNKYLIQAANTGISAFINNHGQIVKRSTIGQQEWLTEKIPLIKKNTVYTNYGEIIVFTAIIYIIMIILLNIKNED